MRRPQGQATFVEPGKADVRLDTFTCSHCQCVVFVQPRQDPSEMGGFCCMCYAHICGQCASTRSCEPFEKKLEAMERRDRLRRAAGI